MTKADVTGVLKDFKAGPWPWVIGLVILSAIYLLRQESRLEAMERRQSSTESQVDRLAQKMDRLVADADTLKRRQELTMCALDPRVLQACGFYTLRARRP